MKYNLRVFDDRGAIMRLQLNILLSFLLFSTFTWAKPSDVNNSDIYLTHNLTITNSDSPEEQPDDGEVVETSDGESAEEQETTPAATQAPDLTNFVFNIDPSLNMSLGYEVSQGDVHLIIEMDHNPTQDQFVFGFHKISPDFAISQVIFENKHFGFNNKSVALLPMIEVQNLGTDSVKFILGTKVNRTHQRINLTKILKEQADKGLLRGSEGQVFSYDDIMEIQVFAKQPMNSNAPSAKKFVYLGIPMPESNNSKIQQIFGEQVLADLTEIATYEVGDTVQIQPGYKIPYRSKDTQWVLRPELNGSEDLITYELIANPKVGDRFSVPKSVEVNPQILPKLKSGYLWVLVEESEESMTFMMAQESAKLSPSIMIKYTKSIIATLDSANQKGQDLRAALINYLENSPLQFQPERLTQVADSILGLNQMQQILQLLMQEQYNYPVLNLNAETTATESSSASQCTSFLSIY